VAASKLAFLAAAAAAAAAASWVGPTAGLSLLAWARPLLASGAARAEASTMSVHTCGEWLVDGTPRLAQLSVTAPCRSCLLLALGACAAVGSAVST
jgi:hypothetical protein